MASFAPMELNCVEEKLKASMKKKFNWALTMGRTAHLTTPIGNRGTCQSRNRCMRAVHTVHIFHHSPLPFRQQKLSGNLTIRPFRLSLRLFTTRKHKSKKCKKKDAETGESHEFLPKSFSTVRLRLEVLKSLCNRHPIVFQMAWVTTVGSWGTM